jgi:hypothetical protein
MGVLLASLAVHHAHFMQGTLKRAIRAVGNQPVDKLTLMTVCTESYGVTVICAALSDG